MVCVVHILVSMLDTFSIQTMVVFKRTGPVQTGFKTAVKTGPSLMIYVVDKLKLKSLKV